MALNPPLCVGFSNLTKIANPSSNIWQITVRITPQGVNSNIKQQYDGTDIRIGDWIGSGNYGYAFQIIGINQATAIFLDCNVQDVNNWNYYQDPSGGHDGGGPVPNSFGYIFQLNSYGLPELTSIPNFPNAVWSDQILGRFASTSVISNAIDAGHTGFTGYTDYDLVRNVGRFAYIEDFSATCVFDGANQELVYTITVIGNATYYDMNFAYSPGSLQTYGTTYSASNAEFFNNSTNPPSGQTNLVYTVPFSVVPTYRSGNFTATITINTHRAGGYGGGSEVTKMIVLSLPNPDTMEEPYFTGSSILGITGPSATISGLKYYTGASYLEVPPLSFYVTNIYNIYDNRNFNYITFGGGGTGAYPASSLAYINPLFNNNYFFFPSASGLNVTYFNYNNNTPIEIPIHSYSPITSTLLNAKGMSSSLTFFPSVALHTWKGSQQYIGYLSNVPDEVNIPLKPTTFFYITAQVRFSIDSSEPRPNTPNTTNLIPFNSRSLTIYDPAYNPFDGCFYASDISLPLSNYVLPTQTSTFTPGVKYLTLALNNQGLLRQFTVNFDINTTTDIGGMWVYWANSPSGKWYDANVDYTVAYGCSGSGHGPYSWPILFNLDDQEEYVKSGGYVFLNIQFKGKIGMSGINITQ